MVDVRREGPAAEEEGELAGRATERRTAEESGKAAEGTEKK